MTKLLIDSDSICYAAGFAADAQWKDMNLAIDATYLKDNALEIVPTSFAAHAARNMLHKILNATPHNTFQLYLSGSSNFRYEVAKSKPYKGNRDRTHKPSRFLEIRAYLIDVWGAEVTEGIEADDILGIEATRDPECVICSIDKDLNQIPGKHYNWKNDKHYEVSEFEGWYNLYTQALTGDVSDNIPGLPKVGPVKAREILQNDKTHRDLYESVLGAYLKRNFSTEYLVEQLNLLYLWRKMPDSWAKPE